MPHASKTVKVLRPDGTTYELEWDWSIAEARRRVIWDIETNGLLDSMDRIHCVAIVDINTGETFGFRPDMVKDAIRWIEFVEYNAGHNILEFDIKAVRLVYPKFKPGGRTTDTLLVSKIVWPHIKDMDFEQMRKDDAAIKFDPAHVRFPKHLIGRHGLEAWGWRFGLHKGDYSKEMKAKGLDPWAEFNEDMLDYCMLDVQVNLKLWREQAKKKPSVKAVRTEHALHDIIRRQEQRGIRFDVDKAFKLYGDLSARRETLRHQIVEMVPPWWSAESEVLVFDRDRRVGEAEFGKKTIVPIGKKGQPLKPREVFNVYREEAAGSAYQKVTLNYFSPNSRDQVADRLQTLFGWKPTEFTETGKPKVDDETLKGLEDIPLCAMLAEFYMIEKRLGQVSEGKEGWLKKQINGRIYGRMDTIGTQTSRATHFSPNLGQVPSLTNADGPVPYGRECRELFTVDDGYVLLGVDCSGLELRCLGHYMAPFDGGEYADQVVNGDIHWTNAMALGLVPMGTVRDKHNKTHEDARAVAKRFIYAFLYGAGPELLGALAGVSDKEIYQWGSNKRVRASLEKKGRHPHPTLVAQIVKGQTLIKNFMAALPALGSLKSWIREQLEANDNCVPGLDGRMIPSRSEHSALNFLLQSAGAIICKQWIVQFHEDLIAAGYVEGEDFAQLLWVHDEVQVQVRPEIADDIKRRILAAIPKVQAFYDFRVPLTGDGMVGNNWAETH